MRKAPSIKLTWEERDEQPLRGVRECHGHLGVREAHRRIALRGSLSC